MANEVTKRADYAVSPYNYGERAGQGYDNQTQDDRAIPMLFLLQAKSPQVEEETVPGAKSGHFWHNISDALFEELRFVMVLTEQTYVEWVPRESGGGFVAIHPPSSSVVQELIASQGKIGKKILPNGNELIQTFTLYALLLDEDDNHIGQAAIPLTSTKITAYRKLNERIQELPWRRDVALYGFRVIMTSFMDERKGHKFQNVRMGFVGGNERESLLPPDSPILEVAEAMYANIKEGTVKVDYAATRATDEGGVDETIV